MLAYILIAEIGVSRGSPTSAKAVADSAAEMDAEGTREVAFDDDPSVCRSVR